MARVGCSICFETSGDSADPFCCVPCGHLFHIPCITEWLHKSRQCPDCRSSCTVAQLVKIFPSLEVSAPKTPAASHGMQQSATAKIVPAAANAHVEPRVKPSHATENVVRAGRAADSAAEALRQWNTLLPRNIIWEKRLSKQTDNARRTDLSFALTDGDEVIANAVGRPFTGLGLHATTVANLNLMGLTCLTAVEAGLTVCVNGRDLTAYVEPGFILKSAYLIPLLSQVMSGGVSVILRQGNVVNPLAVILVPAADSVRSVYREARKFIYRSRVRIAALHGEDDTESEVAELFKGSHVVISTVGRLVSLVKRRIISLASVRCVVIDGIDQMNPGPLTDVMENFGLPVSPKPQMMVFAESDTSRAERFVRNPIVLRVGLVTRCETVFWADDFDEKIQDLLNILEERQDQNDDSVIIYVRTRVTAEIVADRLRDYNWATNVIHGDFSRAARLNSVEWFRSPGEGVLVGTPALDSLDLPLVDVVVHFDLPNNFELYRTRTKLAGYLGRSGDVLAFFGQHNWPIGDDLKDHLEQNGQGVPEFLEDRDSDESESDCADDEVEEY